MLKVIDHRESGSRTQNARDWEKVLKPLFEKYGRRKHPLDYQNKYQLLVVVILSARTSDKLINQLSPPFFQGLSFYERTLQGEA